MKFDVLQGLYKHLVVPEGTVLNIYISLLISAKQGLLLLLLLYLALLYLCNYKRLTSLNII